MCARVCVSAEGFRLEDVSNMARCFLLSVFVKPLLCIWLEITRITYHYKYLYLYSIDRLFVLCLVSKFL